MKKFKIVTGIVLATLLTACLDKNPYEDRKLAEVPKQSFNINLDLPVETLEKHREFLAFIYKNYSLKQISKMYNMISACKQSDAEICDKTLGEFLKDLEKEGR